MSPIRYSPTFEDEVMNAILTPPSTSDAAPAPTDAPEIPPSDIPLALSDARRVHESKIPGVKLTEANGSLFGGSLAQQLKQTAEPGATATAPAPEEPASPAQSPPPPPPPPPPPATTTTITTTGSDAPADVLAALITPLPVSARPTQTQLARALNAATDVQLAELRKRMRARKEALEANARVERELADLKAQRDVEVKIEKRMREEAGQRNED
jgi:hypothetical protein